MGTAAMQRRGEPGDGTGDGVSLLATYRPLLKGRTAAVVSMSALSFVAGIVEAALLVLIANVALTISGDVTSGASLSASLGPLATDSLSVSASFVVVLTLTAIRAALQLASAAIGARLTASLTTEIRADTFADFATASWAEQSSRDESDVQDLLQRHVGRVTGAIGIMTSGIGVACNVAALLISAVLVDPLSAALLVLAGGLLFAIVRPLSRLARGFANIQIEAGRDYNRISLEAVSSSLETRSFGVNQEVSRRLSDATDRETKPIGKSIFLKQLVTTTYQTITVLILVGGLFAVYSVIDRPMAALGAIVIILVRALNQSAGLQSAYHGLVEIQPYVLRLAAERKVLRDSKPSSGSITMSKNASLQFEDVSYSYGGSRFALEHITFSVEHGEAVGIIGPSGSGKSTLIQVLLRLREPNTGRYLVGGANALDINDQSWFDHIAFVPQDSRVINDSIAANITFFRNDVTRDDVVLAAKRAHIHDEIEAMPDGYDTIIGSRGGSLSGGQRQRISIARALLRQPSILVLDEPTSALDMRSETLVHETFTELKGSVTMFAIAHRLSTLNTCDRIMVLGDGRLQAFGSRQDLERDSPFYRDALSLSRIRE